jgi:hypothetical protein
VKNGWRINVMAASTTTRKLLEATATLRRHLYTHPAIVHVALYTKDASEAGLRVYYHSTTSDDKDATCKEEKKRFIALPLPPPPPRPPTALIPAIIGAHNWLYAMDRIEAPSAFDFTPLHSDKLKLFKIGDVVQYRTDGGTVASVRLESLNDSIFSGHNAVDSGAFVMQRSSRLVPTCPPTSMPISDGNDDFWRPLCTVAAPAVAL